MRLFFCSIFTLVILLPQIAYAHLATFGSWETTERYLKTLHPEATEFRVKNDEYSTAEIETLEKQLGFKLYPEDRTPAFYLAMKGNRLLGVAIFIDPRLENSDAEFIRLEVGISVDRKGKISAVRLFEYRGNPELADATFLNQFNGLSLSSNFQISKNPKLAYVAEMKAESQLVANAAREALLLIKTSLGRK